jgi:hypothetical protein
VRHRQRAAQEGLLDEREHVGGQRGDALVQRVEHRGRAPGVAEAVGGDEGGDVHARAFVRYRYGSPLAR